ncbi:MAG: hypothetical protein ABW195_16210 [Ilumatobacteraceae bacterium]
MADIDDLARRTTAMVMSLARRAMGLATGIALVSLVIGGLSYLTGLAALDGSARSAWTLVGAVMLAFAVGAPLLARFRLSSISKDATELVLELGTLISGNPEAQRVVIETVAVDEPDASGATTMPAIIETRQFSRLNQAASTTLGLRTLPGALRALTTFPILLGISIVLTLVFAVLGFLFLVAWAL